MVMPFFDDFFTDRKPSVSAFDRWRNHRKWTSPSKDMAISNWCLWRCRIILGCLIEQTHFLYSYSSMDVNFHRALTFSFRFHQRPQLPGTITFDGEVHFRWFLHRSKAETEGFRSVKKSSKMDITIKRYGDLEDSSYISYSNKVPKMCQYSIPTLILMLVQP